MLAPYITNNWRCFNDTAIWNSTRHFSISIFYWIYRNWYLKLIILLQFSSIWYFLLQNNNKKMSVLFSYVKVIKCLHVNLLYRKWNRKSICEKFPWRGQRFFPHITLRETLTQITAIRNWLQTFKCKFILKCCLNKFFERRQKCLQKK